MPAFIRAGGPGGRSWRGQKLERLREGEFLSGEKLSAVGPCCEGKALLLLLLLLLLMLIFLI